MNDEQIIEEVPVEEEELNDTQENMTEETAESELKETAEETAENNEQAVEENEEDTKEADENKEDEVTDRVDVEQPGNIEAIVEGLLYVVGEDGAKVEQLAVAIDKSLEDTKTILSNIQKKYASELYGIELVGYGSVYKFITKKDVFPYAQELFGATKPNTLSQAALETLAIIAYKQPITRVEIEELRGVSAEVMLRKLQARNLIREAGRSEAVGRPILYEVTEEFMDSFKLYTLKELPDLPEYSKNNEENENLFE